MRNLSKISLVLTGAYSFLLFVFIAEAQRLHFGEAAGDMLVYIEVGAVVCGYIGYRLWKKGKYREVIAGGWFIGALLLGFLSWFIQPDQIYKRASNRIIYLDRYIEAGVSDEAKRRVQIDLAAKKLEYQAAKLRFEGDPQFSWCGLAPWTLWVGAAIFVVNGIITIFSKKKFDENASNFV